MKINFKINLIFIFCVFAFQASANKIKKKENKLSDHKILVLGLQDNVSSNYYYNEMISEQTGIQVDSIDWYYNNVISHNLQSAAAKHNFQFVSSNEVDIPEDLLAKIEVIADKETFASDIKNITPEEYQDLLNNQETDYLLILNQHYLKWQEEPMRTVFHMVSYSLFDKNKNEIYSGNEYFTSMNLETIVKLKNKSRKTSSKIANQIEKLMK